MSGRRRRQLAHEDGAHADERWMASYLDMITVLMCMFIVLFAMSTVDKDKFQALSASLATGFGQQRTQTVDASQGVIVPKELLEEHGEGFADTVLAAAHEEFDELSALRDKMRSALAAQGLERTATFTIDDRGLTIGLVSAETFFATNSTRLSAKAVKVLGVLGGVLAEVKKEISVEGHADERSAAAPFATNWELSSGRSTQVLRYLVEARGVDGTRIKSVGFGDRHPIAKGTSPADLAQNRRVDIVVLSDADEQVRHMLSELQEAYPES